MMAFGAGVLVEHGRFCSFLDGIYNEFCDWEVGEALAEVDGLVFVG